jgi:hypothetical protein
MQGLVVGVLLAASFHGAPRTLAAQQSPLRPGQTPGPRFMVPTLRSDARSLGFQVAEALRGRLAADYDMRTLWLVPERAITEYLEKSGYQPREALSEHETRQLASQFQAEEFIDGTVVRTPTGGYRVEVDWALVRRDGMVQPLPPVEAPKISEVAKLLAQEVQAARKQIESVRKCGDLARARDFTGALAEARRAIAVYPRSALARVCIANVYQQQNLGPDSMIAIAQQIVAIHPENRRAPALAGDAYREKIGKA